ncbi:hypothetical protein [Thermotoga sp. SG1]|uniref:hypothetical protein n=1 Tax=Thermotoga sp. SG1 TaxID=126739 RepID=UPI000C76065D|nr:hypothetical protein [Thermotoga sp. SG1]PLV56754.1 hypothetical protein AS006_03905 [Thermotoga sp. SG1]
MSFNIIVVCPYSPRWSNIASIRWEKLSKYLSLNHKVTLITSSFKEPIRERSFDIGKAKLVEIPLKYYRRNPFLDMKTNTGEFLENSIQHRIKAEARVLLERFFPISSGGMLYHDYRSYKNEISKHLSTNEINILITTYDPWFSIRLGNWFKQKHKNLIWIADFRDPSFNIHESMISRLGIFKSTTKEILKPADVVTVVTHQMKQDYERLTQKKVLFLPNGYDGDLSNLYSDEFSIKKTKNSLTISYTGSLHPETIEISYFTEALKEAKLTSPNTKFIFNYAGFHSTRVKKEFYKRGIMNILKDYGLVERDQAIKLQRESDILLLIAYTGDDEKIGRSIRTGKVYEYLASGKPIIVLAPHDWEMRDEIESDGVSKVFHKSQISEMAKYLIELSQKEDLKINMSARRKVIKKYLYQNLAVRLEEAIVEVVKNI